MTTGSSRIKRWKDNVVRIAAAGNLATSVSKMGDKQIIRTMIVSE
jgi:hypothetical protein